MDECMSGSITMSLFQLHEVPYVDVAPGGKSQHLKTEKQTAKQWSQEYVALGLHSEPNQS